MSKILSRPFRSETSPDLRRHMRVRFRCTVVIASASARSAWVKGTRQVFSWVSPLAWSRSNNSQNRCASAVSESRLPTFRSHCRAMAASTAARRENPRAMFGKFDERRSSASRGDHHRVHGGDRSNGMVHRQTQQCTLAAEVSTQKVRRRLRAAIRIADELSGNAVQETGTPPEGACLRAAIRAGL